MATNLDTLELTINASAERAEQGVDKLISSLSRLSDALTRPFSDLKDLTTELEHLKRLGGMKLSLFDGAKGTTGIRNAARALKEAAKDVNSATRDNGNEGLARTQRELQAQHDATRAANREWAAQQRAARGGAPLPPKEQEPKKPGAYEILKGRGLLPEGFGKQAQLAGSGLEQVQNATQQLTQEASKGAESLGHLDNELKQKKTDGNQASQGLKNAAEGEREVGRAADENAPRVSAFGQLLHQIGRIAKTMIIRTALRALMKSFKATWDSAYNFSKKMGGEFYKDVNRAKQALATMSTSAVKLLAPALQALVPVLTVISAAIEFLCDAITNLLSLLGISSELFGQSAEDMDKYGSSAGGSAKNILAGFDELNVIQKGGGGGGSGGGSPFSGVSGLIKEELAALKVIIGESMLAIGLILAFTGHIGAGLALMVLGVASITSVLTADWNSLPEKVKGTINAIMTIAGTAFLAVGMIVALACPAHLGLGIALIAAGAANLVAISAVQWGGLENPLQAELAKIEAIIGGASLALGAILAFTGNTPTGIALMVAGAAAIAGSATVAWSNKLNEEVQARLVTITETVSTALLALGALLAFTNTNLPLGLALMGAGAAGLATAASIAWTTVSDKVKEQFTAVTAIAGMSLLALGAILAFSSVNIPLGIAMMAAGGISLATAVALNWGSIKENLVKAFGDAAKWLVAEWQKITNAVSSAWNAVKQWWEDNIASKFSAAWKGATTTVTAVWNGVNTSVTNAWNAVKQWWDDNIVSNIYNAWEVSKNFLVSSWKDIKSVVKNTWDVVKQWWETNVGNNVSTAWETAKSFLVTTWKDVKSGAKNAWDIAKQWWETNVSNNVSDAWEKAKSFLVTTWKDIKSGSKNAWDIAKQWWETNVGSNVSDAWENAKSFLVTTWKDIKSGAKNAWDITKQWWEENVSGNISNAWGDAKNFLTSAWKDVKSGAKNAWDIAKQWWETNVKDSLSKKWSDASTYLTGKWKDIKSTASNAWAIAKQWWETNVKNKIKNKWGTAKTYLSGVWTGVTDKIKSAWNQAKGWWLINAKTVLSQKWDAAKKYMSGIWEGIKEAVSGAWSTISSWWDATTEGPVAKIKAAWEGLKSWFKTNITDPISGAFKGAINTIIGFINTVINGLNKLGNFTIPGIKISLPFGLGEVTLMQQKSISLWNIKKIDLLAANGAYDIPNGDLFIANEAGPELVGQMNGKTTVANQEQIIEGIRRGVHDANADQNALLRQQNELLLQILRKDNSIRPSSTFGGLVNKSLQMYGAVSGV